MSGGSPAHQTRKPVLMPMYGFNHKQRKRASSQPNLGDIGYYIELGGLQSGDESALASLDPPPASAPAQLGSATEFDGNPIISTPPNEDSLGMPTSTMLPNAAHFDHTSNTHKLINQEAAPQAAEKDEVEMEHYKRPAEFEPPSGLPTESSDEHDGGRPTSKIYNTRMELNSIAQDNTDKNDNETQPIPGYKSFKINENPISGPHFRVDESPAPLVLQPPFPWQSQYRPQESWGRGRDADQNYTSGNQQGGNKRPPSRANSKVRRKRLPQTPMPVTQKLDSCSTRRSTGKSGSPPSGMGSPTIVPDSSEYDLEVDPIEDSSILRARPRANCRRSRAATGAGAGSVAIENCKEQLYVRLGRFYLKDGQDLSRFKMPLKVHRHTPTSSRAWRCQDGFDDEELGMSGQYDSRQAKRIHGVGVLPLFYHSQSRKR